MSITLVQSSTAIGSSFWASFTASGGTSPYSYSVRPKGIGGTVSTLGVYTPPAGAYGIDTVAAKDAAGAGATATILVGTPLMLFCDIIQSELGLAQGRVYLWDQKIFQPTDSGLFVAVSELSCKPFGNTNSMVNGIAQQSVNMMATVSIDIISRGTDARERKEEVIMSLSSDYAQRQQEANGFYIGKISSGFTNLSGDDGAAIPYRFNISVAMQYFWIKTKSVPYFSTFTDAVTVKS